ncbi:MAG TPA: hypothetical protein DEF62_01925 [Porphyromonas gingivalis]|nr:hypothetical protein [Porphyromonas gingivalis]
MNRFLFSGASFVARRLPKSKCHAKQSPALIISHLFDWPKCPLSVFGQFGCSFPNSRTLRHQRKLAYYQPFKGSGINFAVGKVQ